MDKKKLLGKRIKEIRKARGLTQEKLAELIDIETCSLSAIEIGRHYPSMPTIEKIAENLDVELKAFFEFGILSTNLLNSSLSFQIITLIAKIIDKIES